MDAERPFDVLLVDDNEDDVFITKKSFERSKLDINLHHVENGRQCMDYLRKQGGYEDATTPDLVMLDLNMPLMDGREVLAEISKDPVLCKFPIVVLTTSENDRDVVDMYNLRCNSYITKPVIFQHFKEVVKSIYDYWFTIAVLPNNHK